MDETPCCFDMQSDATVDAPMTRRMGDRVFVRFPQDETGKLRKLSRPWHGPYRVTTLSELDITKCV